MKNQIKKLGASSAQVKASYSSVWCIKNDVMFISVSSKKAVENFIRSNDNNDMGAVIGFSGDNMYLLIQSGAKDFSVKLIDPEGSIVISWIETTITKALARFDSVKQYHTALKSIVRVNTDTFEEIYQANLRAENKEALYTLGRNIRRHLEMDFQNATAELKDTITKLINDGEFLEANKMMSKLFRKTSSYSYSSDVREIELQDITKFEYRQHPSDKIENYEGINVSSWGTLSSIPDIRVAAGKVLKQYKTQFDSLNV